MDNCTEAVERDYLFYLSFENSLCDHYVTEKLWMRLRQNVVPIVLGQANYSAIVPPNSVISAMDFPEPRRLAEHLRSIMADEARYLSFFWWKDHYTVNTDVKSDAFCRLCQMLHDPKQPVQVRTDLEQWWRYGAHCKRKGAMPWAKYAWSPIVDNWLVNSVLGKDPI